MSEMAKRAREALKEKARRLAGAPDRKVDSSTWTPSRPLNTAKKTGASPITKPSSKGIGESNAARDTKSAIGDAKRGAFKKGGAVKGRETGGRLPPPEEAMESEVRQKNIKSTDTKMPAPEEAAERSGKTKQDVPGRKHGGKAKRPGRDLGGVMQILSPAYAAIRALQRGGKDEEHDTNEQAKGMAMANAMNRKKGGKVDKRDARKSGGSVTIINLGKGASDAPMNAPTPPGGPMPAAQPPMPPAPMPTVNPPGVMPPPNKAPLGLKTGGRAVKVAKSYKDMRAGAGSGEGRLQKTDVAKRA